LDSEYLNADPNADPGPGPCKTRLWYLQLFRKEHTLLSNWHSAKRLAFNEEKTLAESLISPEENFTIGISILQEN
jgi:hypothetical protein